MSSKAFDPKAPHIKPSRLVRLAIGNILYKKFRSILTVGGVVLGLGSIYALASFGLGVQQLVQNEIINNQSINTVDISSTNTDIVKITPELLDKVAAVPHVTKVSGSYTAVGNIELGTAKTNGVAYGVDSLYLETSNIVLAAGNWPKADSTEDAIVNQALLQSVGITEANEALNKTLKVTIGDIGTGKTIDKTITVRGIVESGKSAELYVSTNVFKEGNIFTFTQARAVVDDRANIAQARQAIESFGLETTSPVDTVDQINEVFKFFNLALLSVGSIGMIIAILGMLNTLTVSLIERTREIALMVILGARSKDVHRLFIVEAVILSVSGAIIGIIFATILGMTVDTVLNAAAQDRGVGDTFSVFFTSPALVLGTLAVAVLIGLLVALVPAYRATRIDPMEALRRE